MAFKSFYDLRLTNNDLRSSGFTLAELMIIVSLIAILIIGIIWGWQKQTDRGYDAKRKADLKNIQNAFDDYYNDKNCYPPVSILSNCGSTDLAPYIAEIPCDPHTHQPYKYRPLSVDGGQDCSGYRVLTTLKDKEDLDIKRVGCNADWCGFTDVPTGYNYGVSMGVQVPKDGFISTSEPPTPTPTPAGGPHAEGQYACTGGRRNGTLIIEGANCNDFGSQAATQARGCPTSFAANDCENNCASDYTVWCP